MSLHVINRTQAMRYIMKLQMMRNYKGCRNSEKELVIVALNASKEGGILNWVFRVPEIWTDGEVSRARQGQSTHSLLTKPQCDRFCDS